MQKENTALFERYAHSWYKYRKTVDLQNVPSNKNIFVCPLCLQEFSYNLIDELTKEHVPPSTLGGVVKTLTCKKCNNGAGSLLESKLKNFLHLKKYFSGEIKTPPKLDSRIFFSSDSNISVDMRWKSPKEGKFLIRPNRTNPKYLSDFKDFLERGDDRFTLKYTYDDIHSSIALLRSAYLDIFNIFGYSLIFDPIYDVIRTQINNPLKHILPKTDSSYSWILPATYPDEWIGVNIIYYPDRMMSFLCIYDLIISDGITERIGIILPSPRQPGLNVYRTLIERFGKEIEFAREPLSTFLSGSDLATIPFSAHSIWDGFLKHLE